MTTLTHIPENGVGPCRPKTKNGHNALIKFIWSDFRVRFPKNSLLFNKDFRQCWSWIWTLWKISVKLQTRKSLWLYGRFRAGLGQILKNLGQIKKAQAEPAIFEWWPGQWPSIFQIFSLINTTYITYTTRVDKQANLKLSDSTSTSFPSSTSMRRSRTAMSSSLRCSFRRARKTTNNRIFHENMIFFEFVQTLIKK